MKKKIVVFSLIFLGLLQISCKKNSTDRIDTRKTKIKIMLSWTPGPENAFLYYGIDKGIFEKYLLDVDVIPSKGSSVVASALSSDGCDYAFISSDYLLMARANSLPIKALFVLYHNSPVTIFSLAEKNIVKPKDLVGKRMGVLNKSAAYPQVILFFKKELINIKEIIEVPSTGNVVELLEDKVDAAMNYTNYAPVTLRVKAKRKINEILLKDYGIKLYGTAIATNENNINNNIHVERFVFAMLDSLKAAKDDHIGALNSLLKHAPELEKDVQDIGLKITESMIYSPETKELGIGYMDAKGWDESLKTLMEAESIKSYFPVSSVYEERYLNKYLKKKNE
jgi:NitT/TauT family transport system substrate-binding protein